MSVIAFDGRTIAADRQITHGTLRLRGSKIRKLLNGDVLAWAGTMENGIAMAQWYEKGADPAAFPASQKTDDWCRLIVIPKKGRPFAYEQLPLKQFVYDQRAAWGLGRDFAMGAMEMGADAVMAVKIASRLCTSCGMGVESFKVR